MNDELIEIRARAICRAEVEEECAEEDKTADWHVNLQRYVDSSWHQWIPEAKATIDAEQAAGYRTVKAEAVKADVAYADMEREIEQCLLDSREDK